MKMFQENKYAVHVATDTNEEIMYCNKKINIRLKRNPYNIMNAFSLLKLHRLVKKEKYSLISCHTPIGAFLGRVCVLGISKKKRPKIIYTAHGFHFYKGGSIINWIIYYPVEKILSRLTDAIITMNEEDYLLARKNFYCDVYKINGIGLRKKRLIQKDKGLRKRLNLKNKFIVSYIAEFSKRKNQLPFIRKLNSYKISRHITFLFIGDSNIKNLDKKLSKYKNIKYISFKENIADYINISDLIISPSKQEGLPQNILEALYFNKPVIGMNIRGTKDLLSNGYGILVNNLDEMIKQIIAYEQNPQIMNAYPIEKYLVENVTNDVKNILNKYLSKKLK